MDFSVISWGCMWTGSISCSVFYNWYQWQLYVSYCCQISDNTARFNSTLRIKMNNHLSSDFQYFSLKISWNSFSSVKYWDKKQPTKQQTKKTHQRESCHLFFWLIYRKSLNIQEIRYQILHSRLFIVLYVPYYLPLFTISSCHLQILWVIISCHHQNCWEK